MVQAELKLFIKAQIEQLKESRIGAIIIFSRETVTSAREHVSIIHTSLRSVEGQIHSCGFIFNNLCSFKADLWNRGHNNAYPS